jgi:hypothetical protein
MPPAEDETGPAFLALHEPAELELDRLAVLGMQELERVAADELLGTAAEDTQDRRVAVREDAVFVHFPDPLRGRLDDRPELRLTVREGRLRAATLVELTQSQAAQVQAASALVNARYTLVFQQSLMSYYTGELDPTNVRLGD